MKDLTHGGTKGWSGSAFLLALAASLVLLFAPLGTRVESSAGGGSGSQASPEQPSSSESTVSHVSLLEEQGWSVALPLSIPVVLAGGGLLASASRGKHWLIVMSMLLGAFVLLGALSVGVFYLPAEAAMIGAAAKERRR